MTRRERGASMQILTRPPWMAEMVSLILSSIAIDSPGFRVRTSMDSLPAQWIDLWTVEMLMHRVSVSHYCLAEGMDNGSEWCFSVTIFVGWSYVFGCWLGPSLVPWTRLIDGTIQTREMVRSIRAKQRFFPRIARQSNMPGPAGFPVTATRKA